MNMINIWQPRWRDRCVLVAKWRVGEYNQINISHHSYPEPLYMSGMKLRTYPLETQHQKNGQPFKVYAVPIDDFMTVAEKEDILTTIGELGW